jgi:hypothetical protein
MAHDHAHAEHPDHKADARAAFMGLILGAITLLALVLVIVKLTNRKFDSHAAAPAHSQSTPATGAPPAVPAQQPTKTPH